VIIYNTKVNAGDDGICMKSSGTPKNGEALLQNVIIAECTVNEGHGGFVIGSNTDGGMKNIYVSNCTFDGTDIGIRVKSNSGRGGDVSQIFIDNIEMKTLSKKQFCLIHSMLMHPWEVQKRVKQHNIPAKKCLISTIFM
jgi:polygalacturonase